MEKKKKNLSRSAYIIFILLMPLSNNICYCYSVTLDKHKRKHKIYKNVFYYILHVRVKCTNLEAKNNKHLAKHVEPISEGEKKEE